MARAPSETIVAGDTGQEDRSTDELHRRHVLELSRATEGYLFDCEKNVDIVSDDPDLQDLWTWIQGADEVVKDLGMCHDRLDLSYLGVNAVWRGDLGVPAKLRILVKPSEPATNTEFTSAVAAINSLHKRPPHSSPTPTFYPQQRSLCLAICGWALTPTDFEIHVQALERCGRRTQAAAIALFHSLPHRAISSLFAGSDAERLLAMALASFFSMPRDLGMKSIDAATVADIERKPWVALCQSLRSQVTDPYALSILDFINSAGDPVPIINSSTLPIRFRLLLALQHAPDAQLTSLLSFLTTCCVENGDLQGISLTGLGTVDALSLFENFVARTGDVQTAVLAMSFASPAYLPRAATFNRWRDQYRARLDAKGLFVKRALLDTGWSKKAVGRGSGISSLTPPPRQITVRCNFCDESVAHEAAKAMKPTIVAEGLVVGFNPPVVGSAPNGTATQSNGEIGGSFGSSGTHQGNPLNDSNPGGSGSGSVCPSCGRHLPRCGVCLMYLGQPDSSRPGGVAALGDHEAWVKGDKNGGKDSRMAKMMGLMEFCAICHHGFHSGHAREWFAKHRVCPIAGCGCTCEAGTTTRRRPDRDEVREAERDYTEDLWPSESLLEAEMRTMSI